MGIWSIKNEKKSCSYCDQSTNEFEYDEIS